MVDATQSDAEEVIEETLENIEEVKKDQEAKEESIKSPRDAAMDKIVEDRELEVFSEIVEQHEDLDTSTEERDEEEIQQEDPISPIWLKDGKWFTTVKVNGTETNVPFEGLKVSHQKDAASQQRFEEAATKEKWLNQKESQLRSYVQKLQARPQATPPKTQDDKPKTDTNFTEVAKEYHQALYEDDAEKAAELLQTLTSGRSQGATPNVEEAVNKALQEAFSRQQMEQARTQQRDYQTSVKDAVSWFETEYPEIAGNAELRAIADNRTVTIMKEKPSLAPGYVIQAAAEYAREWANLNLSNGKSNERADRKKRIVSEPRPARRSAKIGDDDEVEKTPSQVIEEMRAERGQQL
jgi:hypothetical protein|tara:strand:+ start:1218 stop:2273 length:1056 start_codon:yes stop_codon:yes gene_type:complete